MIDAVVSGVPVVAFGLVDTVDPLETLPLPVRMQAVQAFEAPEKVGAVVVFVPVEVRQAGVIQPAFVAVAALVVLVIFEPYEAVQIIDIVGVIGILEGKNW